MLLSDSLTPSGPSLEPRVLTPAPAVLTADQTVDNQVSGLISTGLQRVYGPASEEARTSIAEARAAEGAGAFDRIVDNPDAYAPVENVTYAPHLREAYRYQEWVAAERGVSLPDTHLLADPPPEGVGMSAGSSVPETADRVSEDVRSITPAQDALRIRQLLDPVGHVIDPTAPTLAGAFDYGVTERDLEAIQAIVESFPSVEWGSLVLSSLTKVEADGTSELDRWAANLMDPGIQGGFGGDERFEHYKVLAEHLDATQLDRFAQAVARGGSADENQWFGYAVGETAPIASLTALITSASARGRTDDRLGPMVAELIEGVGKRDPGAISEQLNAYSDVEVERLVSHATYDKPLEADLPVVPSSTGPLPEVRVVDAVSLGRMLDGAAHAGNTEARGRFFSEGAEEMIRLNNLASSDPVGIVHTGVGEGVESVRGGLSNLMNSDPDGVIGHVRTLDEYGVQMTAYVGELLKAGDTDRIRYHLACLVRGNGQQETPQERFGNESGTPAPTDEQRNNALALGHYAGAVAAALGNVYADHEAQVQVLADVLSISIAAGSAATGAGGAVYRAVRGAATAAGRSGSETVAGYIADAFDDFSAGGDLSTALMEIARPHVPDESRSTDDMRPYDSPTMTDNFTGQYDHVYLSNLGAALRPGAAR